jgi:hypothetical protein
MGRPQVQFTACDRRLIDLMGRYGFQDSEIAKEMGVDVKTLVKHAHADLRVARARTTLAVHAALHRAAERGSVTALLAVIKLGENAEARRAANARPATQS